jgi:xylulokinase
VTKWLVYDIGSTGTKAALMEGDSLLETVTQGYQTHFADGGVVEQHAADWWAALLACTRSLAGAADANGIILTGQMQDLILLDQDGAAVRPVILYSDTRAHAESAAVVEALGAPRLRELTGNDQDAGSLLAKLRWLQTHEPQSLVSARHLLTGAADFAVLRMTGRALTDVTTASTTGLLELATRTLHGHALLEQIGLGAVAALLPEVVAGGTLAGSLLPDAAQALGLPVGLPVYLAGGDLASATIGANAGEPGSAYAYVGTSGWVAFTAPHPADPDQGVITVAHPAAGYYIAVAPLMTAAGNLDWIRQTFEKDSAEDLIAQALAADPAPLLYLPYLNGERAPFSDPFARGSFVGLSAQTRQPDLVRAVLEGVALAYRHTLDALAPADLTHLTLMGGGTQSLAWCQLFADVLQVPVLVAEDGAHSGLLGALHAVAVGAGQAAHYSLSSAPIAHRLVPRQAHREYYRNKYALFRQSYYALKPLFRALQTL